MCPATWTLDLVDVNDTPLTTGGLTLASAGVVTAQAGSAPMMFQGLLPLSSDAAAVVAGTGEIDAYVKAYRTPEGGTIDDRVLQLNGSVWVDEVQGANNVVMITVMDQLAMLAKRFTLAQFAPDDLGDLLKQMIDTTNSVDGETGIRTNSSNIIASSSIDIDARTNRPTIMSLAQQFAGQLDGCEAWVVPFELSGGKICDLYVAPQRGGVSAAVFGFGEGTAANCSDMTRARDRTKVENDVNGYSEALTSKKFDATSIAALRRLVGYTSYTGETDQGALDARTQGRLSMRSTLGKVAEYTVAPAPNSPVLFDDYGIGDVVTLDFRRGQVEWQTQQRAMLAKLNLVPGPNGLVEQPGDVQFLGLPA